MRRPADSSDRELLVEGDAEAFGVFYDRHVEWVLGLLARRLRDPHLAADVTAEVFAAALAGRRRYRSDAPEATGWLFRIALNKLNDALRRGYADDRGRRRLAMQPVVPDDEALAVIERLGQDFRALHAVEALPEEQRRATMARIVDELPYDVIARQEGTSETVIRKRVSRGLGSLRRELEDRP